MSVTLTTDAKTLHSDSAGPECPIFQQNGAERTIWKQRILKSHRPPIVTRVPPPCCYAAFASMYEKILDSPSRKMGRRLVDGKTFTDRPKIEANPLSQQIDLLIGLAELDVLKTRSIPGLL